MNCTTKRKKIFRRTQERLTREEIEAIRGLNLGYGHFAANAKAVGIHKNTFRYILDRGYGTTEFIRKIRKTLIYYVEGSPY